MTDSRRYICSFCAKTDKQVKKIIAGPGESHICDECVSLCAEIIDHPRMPYDHDVKRIRVLYNIDHADGRVVFNLGQDGLDLAPDAAQFMGERLIEHARRARLSAKPAQGTEARRGETEGLDAKREGPVAEGDAP